MTYEEAMAIKVFAAKYTFVGDPEDEMGYDTLVYRVRDEWTTPDGGYSDAELWSDVIVPAIVDGRIVVIDQ